MDEAYVVPVLKANAYGHGLVNVAKVFARQNTAHIPFFVVETYFEAERLRRAGITKPVLIIGYSKPEIITENTLTNVMYTASSLDTLRKLGSTRTSLQLNVNTGMNRYGIDPAEIPAAINVIRANGLRVVGAFSHLCDAYEPDSQFTHKQIKTWNAVAKKLEDHLKLDYLHLAATSGHYYREDIRANTERLGLGLYGVSSYASNLKLTPALSMETQIAQIRTVPAGETIGYNRTFRTDRDGQIAVLPIGYEEGIDRRLTHTGAFKVAGEFCPVVGAVSMNATTIDVTDVNAQVGDRVEVISSDPTDRNAALDMAERIDTIPHVLLTGIPASIKREMI